MIGFGCVTTSEPEFRAGAAEVIELAAEPDSLLMRRHGKAPVGPLCNEMLDVAAEWDDLEAFVLLAEDVTTPPNATAAGWGSAFLAELRRLLVPSSDVALIGAAGGLDLDKVDLLDGCAVVFSPWALRELRFDDALAVPFDCGVADLCHQAQARDRLVATGKFDLGRAALCRRLGDRGRLVRGKVAVWRKWSVDLELER